MDRIDEQRVGETASLPLSGVRIIDWTTWQQGPAATCMLGNLGAEVIKIEPKEGEAVRGITLSAGYLPAGIGHGRNFVFESLNFDKKSLALDLKHPKTREIVRKLISNADVFVHNFRPGVAERLNLTYDIFKECNPRIIYASISGYGSEGPDANKSAMDISVQARSGLMLAAGEEGMPPIIGCKAFADQLGGIMFGSAIILALLIRERLGIGQELKLSSLHCCAYLEATEIYRKLLVGEQYPRWSRSRPGNPLWNYYRCADDKWLCLGMMQADRLWHSFCGAVGLEHLERDPRFENLSERGKNTAEFTRILDELFASRPRQHWVDALSRNDDLQFSVVNTISELLADPQVVANNVLEDFEHPVLGKIRKLALPFGLSKTPARTRMAAPELGEHTEEILTGLCRYSWEEIEDMKNQGVIP